MDINRNLHEEESTFYSQPWAWAILYAGKDIENRSWKTKIRGPIAVHASRLRSRGDYEWAVTELSKVSPRIRVPPYNEMVEGAIVGLVDLVGCEEATDSKWHAADCYGFVLANPRPLPKPITCKGALNFWTVPDTISRSILRQLR